MPRLVLASRTPLARPAAIVRAAAFHEHADIGALLLRANLEHRKVLPATTHESYTHELCMLTRSHADKDFLVAESDGKLVGAVAFYRDASCIRPDLPREWAGLRALGVDPDARGCGIGRQLAEACALRAWRIGRAAICLHNAAFQRAARALYLAIGFERCPQHDIDAPDLLDVAGKRIAIEAFSLDLRT